MLATAVPQGWEVRVMLKPSPRREAVMSEMEQDANITESWVCVDCGITTAPGVPPGPLTRMLLARDGSFSVTVNAESEIYMVRSAIWKKAGMKPFGGCLCIGCLEKRLGRKLKRRDFDQRSPFENTAVSLKGTPRLLDRRRKGG